MGGAVGEVHGAKLTGLFERAIDQRPAAVLLLLESGGVRLHEANAGLIAVSETMRALLDARAAGIPVVGLIGSSVGCFGGMGLIAACCDTARHVRGRTARHVGARSDRDEARASRSSTRATARSCGARPAASIAT